MKNVDRLERNQEGLIKLSGSDRAPIEEAECVGPVSSDEIIDVTLLVRRPSVDQLLEKVGAPYYYKESFLTREKFENLYGAHPGHLNQIKDFAKRHNLEIKEVNAAGGTVVLSGKVSDINPAFGIDLMHFKHPHLTYIGHTGHVYVPNDLADIIDGVLGLDNRPQARAHYRILSDGNGLVRAQSANQSYPPNNIAKLYNFPEPSSRGEIPCIGIIELGGGYDEQDLQTYFSQLGIPEPQVTSVSVNGATNSPTGDPNSADGEVMLDIEVAGAVAPGVKIAVYFAPNTDAGFLNAIKTAIHDKTNNPSVISISWGSAEANWTKQSMTAMDRAFQDAAALGVTICCAAGDQGSSDGVNDGYAHVDFPASSPNVLACGGTKLTGSGTKISQEVVWNESASSATGGGISAVFSLPGYQKAANVPPSVNPGNQMGRGVPDVAGDADPVTGYQVLVGGNMYVFGGTSAVAPLWAGLLAVINQQLGHNVGFVNPALYNPTTACSSMNTGITHDITQGNNDTVPEPNAYPAKAGWDACTGLGSPNGTQLLAALKQLYQTK